MSASNGRKGSDVRARLDHPVVDGDGHVQEADFALPDFLKQVGGPSLVERWQKLRADPVHRNVRFTLWNQPSGKWTIDRAMAMFPKLRKARHEECGIDYAIVYTTRGLGMINHSDDELRRGGCRAFNMLNADLFADVKDCMTPAAVIPMNTPGEALEELEFAVKTLGFKTVQVSGEVRAPEPEIVREAPHLAAYSCTVKPVGLDSEHDYDPFWKRCVELKVSVAGHTGDRGRGTRRNSPSNFCFNHIGSFAAGNDFFCRSIFMGGVPKRFPTLKFAFLEGGVAWASALYNSLVEHFEKRSLDAMLENLDPAKLDVELMARMAAQYGKPYHTAERMLAYRHTDNSRANEDRATLDEWRQSGVRSKQDIRDLFVPNFYFGCEADDRLNPMAFNPKLHSMGARLKALFSSDIGHWDVVDATQVVCEAYEQVERDMMSTEDFRDFMFTHSVELHGGMNPDFFKGTTVEAGAAKVLARAV